MIRGRSLCSRRGRCLQKGVELHGNGRLRGWIRGREIEKMGLTSQDCAFFFTREGMIVDLEIQGLHQKRFGVPGIEPDEAVAVLKRPQEVGRVGRKPQGAGHPTLVILFGDAKRHQVARVGEDGVIDILDLMHDQDELHADRSPLPKEVLKKVTGVLSLGQIRHEQILGFVEDHQNLGAIASGGVFLLPQPKSFQEKGNQGDSKIDAGNGGGVEVNKPVLEEVGSFQPLLDVPSGEGIDEG